MDAFATSISMALQYGVPLEALVEKFSHVRFEPSGMTKNPEIRFAKSIVDYIFRWLATKFLSPEAQYRAGVNIEEPQGAAGRAQGAESSPVSDPKVTISAKPEAGPAFNRPESNSADRHSADRHSADRRSGPSDDRRSGPSGPQASSFAPIQNQEDAPPCSTCGSIMIRSGSCYKCTNCGTTSGCA